MHVCTCTELRCSAEQFRYEGKLYQGKGRGIQAGRLHDVKVRRIQKSQTNLDGSSGVIGTSGERPAGKRNARRRSLSTSDIPAHTTRAHDSSRPQGTGPLALHSLDLHSTGSMVPILRELQTFSANHLLENDLPFQHIKDSNSNEFCTEPFRLQEVYLLRPSCLIAMLQVAKATILNHASDEESRTTLHLSKLQAEQSAIENGYTGRPYWEDMPTTVPTLYRMLNLYVSLSSKICCPACFALHGEPYPEGDIEYKLLCDDMRFLRDPDISKETLDDIRRSKCNEDLYTKESKRKALRIFYHQSLRTWLAKMMFLPDFEDALEASLLHAREDGSSVMTDVWDGEMWIILEYWPANRYKFPSFQFLFKRKLLFSRPLPSFRHRNTHLQFSKLIIFFSLFSII